MAQDRPDLGVTACNLAKTMAKPKVGDEALVKRVCRYLQAYPKYYQHYCYQEEPNEISLYTDSDWATCRTTRKSCSRGLVMLGDHLLLHWCRLQDGISLSSGE